MEQALARFKVAATQQKAELIDGRSQARGGLLDRRGEIEIQPALETIEHRGRFEGFLLDVLRIFIRGIADLLAGSYRVGKASVYSTRLDR